MHNLGLILLMVTIMIAGQKKTQVRMLISRVLNRMLRKVEQKLLLLRPVICKMRLMLA